MVRRHPEPCCEWRVRFSEKIMGVRLPLSATLALAVALAFS